MTDISEITYVEKTIEIVHPSTKEPLGIFVTVMSPDDPRLETIKSKVMDERLALEAKGKNFKAEQINKNRDMILFRAMTGWKWEGTTTFEGEKPDFIQVNVLNVFNKLPWFRKQVDESFSELEGFFNDTKLN
jgi:hypothetical protein